MLEKYLTYDDVTIIPNYSDITSRSKCNTSPTFFFGETLSLPIISSPMATVTGSSMAITLNKKGCIGALHRFNTIEEQVKEYTLFRYGTVNRNENKFSDSIIMSIGATGDYKERAAELYKAGSRNLLIDVAHGHHLNVKNSVEYLKSNYSGLKIMAGNITTGQAYKDYIDWGVDSARVGVGSGSLCETRIRTGVGLPMFSTIQNIAEERYRMDDQWNKKSLIPIVADGGIRKIQDVCKAIGAGADFVMVGSLFAGTTETPSETVKVGDWPNEQLYKKYYGSASLEAKLSIGQEDKNIEGTSTLISYKGSVVRLLDDIKDGLQSSMSYVGAKNIYEYQRKCKFVEITQEGQREGRPHLLG